MTTTKEKLDITNLEIRLGDEFVNIDLTKQCPQSLLATAKYVKKPYIPIKLIRKIGRKLFWNINVIKTDVLVTETWIIIDYIIDINIDKKKYQWSARDYIGWNSVAKSLDWQNARIKALAIKDALKRVYPFFDINFDEADEAMDSKKEEIAIITKDKKDSIEQKQESKNKIEKILLDMEKFNSVDELKKYMTANKDFIKLLDKKNKEEILILYSNLIKKLG